MPVPRLHPQRTALLVVDVQERLLPAMDQPQTLLVQIARLIDGANVLEIPILLTEQYRKGLGPTVPQLASKLANARCVAEKLKFSAYVEPVREALSQAAITSVIVAGIEAHVCVAQTCLDLIDAGYVTALAIDAITSRRPLDKQVAIQRLTHAGVLPTTVEACLFELLHEAGGERFKALLPILK
jgi:nicotinamidase-related amidase